MMPAFATLTVCCSITSCSCARHEGVHKLEDRAPCTASGRLKHNMHFVCSLPLRSAQHQDSMRVVIMSAPPAAYSEARPGGSARHGAGAVGHLVELVDAADALVAQHQRAALQHHLPRLRVLPGSWCGQLQTGSPVQEMAAERLAVGRSCKLGRCCPVVSCLLWSHMIQTCCQGITVKSDNRRTCLNQKVSMSIWFAFRSAQMMPLP